MFSENVRIQSGESDRRSMLSSPLLSDVIDPVPSSVKPLTSHTAEAKGSNLMSTAASPYSAVNHLPQTAEAGRVGVASSVTQGRVGVASSVTHGRVGVASSLIADRVGVTSSVTAGRVGVATSVIADRGGVSSSVTAGRVGGASSVTADRVGVASSVTAGRVGVASSVTSVYPLTMDSNIARPEMPRFDEDKRRATQVKETIVSQSERLQSATARLVHLFFSSPHHLFSLFV